MDHNEKMSEHMDKLGEHHDGMADHIDGMKDCLGKAIASGKLKKVEDDGDTKDMTTHMSGIEDAHGEMGKTHDAIEKLIDEQEEALDNANGAIDDAVASADEETDKGLTAAERTEKRYTRKIAAIQKANKRENALLKKEMKKSVDAATRATQDGLNQLLKALTPVPPPPSHVEKVVPVRTVSLEKSADGGGAPQQPGQPPVAKVSTGAQIPAVDEYGMPNPEYLKAVESGQVGRDGSAAFHKAAKEVPMQVGDPFPKNDTNLFSEIHRPGPVN